MVLGILEIVLGILEIALANPQNHQIKRPKQVLIYIYYVYIYIYLFLKHILYTIWAIYYKRLT